MILKTVLSQPNHIIDPLYNASDHLPVKLKLTSGKLSGSFTSHYSDQLVQIQNPVTDHLIVKFGGKINGDLTIEVFTLSGNIVISETDSLNNSGQDISNGIGNLVSGFYLLTFRNDMNIFPSKKFIKI